MDDAAFAQAIDKIVADHGNAFLVSAHPGSGETIILNPRAALGRMSKARAANLVAFLIAVAGLKHEDLAPVLKANELPADVLGSLEALLTAGERLDDEGRR